MHSTTYIHQGNAAAIIVIEKVTYFAIILIEIKKIRSHAGIIFSKSGLLHTACYFYLQFQGLLTNKSLKPPFQVTVRIPVYFSFVIRILVFRTSGNTATDSINSLNLHNIVNDVHRLHVYWSIDHLLSEAVKNWNGMSIQIII